MTTNPNTELLPCPFGCGGFDGRPGIESDEDDEWDSSRVICGDCGATGPYAYHPDYEDIASARSAAITAWNTRLAAAETRPAAAPDVLRPITMQDVRLGVGEGPLTPADVLMGCNAELRRRAPSTTAEKGEA